MHMWFLHIYIHCANDMYMSIKRIYTYSGRYLVHKNCNSKGENSSCPNWQTWRISPSGCPGIMYVLPYMYDRIYIHMHMHVQASYSAITAGSSWHCAEVAPTLPGDNFGPRSHADRSYDIMLAIYIYHYSIWPYCRITIDWKCCHIVILSYYHCYHFIIMVIYIQYI